MAIQDLDYRVSVNDAALNGLIAKVTELNAALFNSAAATKPLDAQLRAFGRRTTEIGRFLTRNVTLPLGLLGAASVRAAVDFDKAMTKIAALTDTTGQQVEVFKKQIQDLAGREVTGGPQQLAEALYFIRSSGIDAAHSMDVLTQSNRAAVASGTDVQTMADAVTSAMNAYADQNLQAAEATDVLLETVKLGKAEPAALARAIGLVIPLAHQMGVSFKEVGEGLSVLTLQGLSAQQSVTGMRAILTTFAKGLVPTQQALAGLGFRISDVNEAISKQGLLPTLITLRKEVDRFDKSGGQLDAGLVKAAKLGGFDAAVQKLRKNLGTTSDTLVAKLFPNIRALTSFLILTSNAGKQTGAIMQQFAEDTATVGAVTEKAAKEVNSTEWGKLNIQINRLRNDMIKLGEALLPFVNTVASALGGIASLIGKLPKPIKDLALAWGILFAVVGPGLTLLGTLIRAISPLAIKNVRSIKQWTAAQTQLTAAVAGTTAAEDALAAASARAAATGTAAAGKFSKATVVATGNVKKLTAAEEKAARIARVSMFGTPGGTGVVGRGRFARETEIRGVTIPPAAQFATPLAQARTREVLQTGLRSGFSSGGQDLFLAAKGAKELGVAARGASVGVRILGGALGMVADVIPQVAILSGIILAWEHRKEIVRNLASAMGDLAKEIGNVATSSSHRFDPGAGSGNKDFLAGLNPKVIDATKQALAKLTAEGYTFADAVAAVRASESKMPEDFRAAVEQAIEEVGGSRSKAQGAAAGAKIAKAATAAFAKEMQADTSMVKAIRAKLDEASQQLKGDLDKAFDARTDAMLQNVTARVRVVANGIREAFTIKPGEQTPAERELAAMQKQDTLLRDRRAIEDARAALAEAQRARHVETRVGNRIFGFDVQADKGAIKDAKRNLKDAQRALVEDQLGFRADAERKAADKALAQQQKNLQARRDLEKRHFTEEYNLIVENLRKGYITQDGAQKRIIALLGKYHIDYKTAGNDLGTAFVTGLNESLDKFLKEGGKLSQVIKVIKALIKAGPTGGEKKVAGTSTTEPNPPHGRAGAAAVQGVGTTQDTVAGVPIEKGHRAGVYIAHMSVSNDVQAEVVANRIARKVVRR